jgi:dTDP-4-amino-4,6-dideoxygalactose transaminase
MIKSFDYLKLLPVIEADIMDGIRRVLYSGKLILGPETDSFEQEFAHYVGVKNCIGVSSGTSALHLALLTLNIGLGDEVITVSNTCVPTVAAIELTGAKPVFVDVLNEDLMIDPELVARAITKRTKCILPVHLWGQGVDMCRLIEISKQTGIPIVEDCAQAQGTYINGQHAGTFGELGCFSFYPTKNLGAYGDAGAIITDNDELAARIRRKRVYGYTRSNYSEESGMNARISELQSCILRVKLRYLKEWLERRCVIAARFMREINNPAIQMPYLHDDQKHAYHQFVIRCRNRPQIIQALEANFIEYGIHYPTPVHQMPAYRSFNIPLPVTESASDEILSIPIHEALLDSDVEKIITTLNNYI